ncbi:hypothetical protein EMN47_20180 [Prolixibacteraceae bacterium JC049]|nr:hypothetical protein [Prolixibacteraceae bacterium JC049]
MINKIILIIALVLLVTGGYLLKKSSELEIYKNKAEYEDKYMQLTGEDDDSQKFYELREKYLTPKHKFEDYGITTIILGFILSIISLLKIRNLRSPRKWWILLTVGVFAAILTIFGYVGDLFLEMTRDSYPPWADSLAIPLMGTPALLMMSIVWVILNLLGTKNKYQTKANLFPINIRESKKWYLVISLITILLIIMVIIDGYFWQLLSGFLWLYFYLSIMQGLKNDEKGMIKTEANNV